MEVKFYPSFPKHRGEVIEIMLKVVKANQKYDVWSINDDLEAVQCKGVIENNGSWNYHNNYDDSEDEMYCIFKNGHKIARWFSFNEDEVKKIQKENIIQYRKLLEEEITKLAKI